MILSFPAVRKQLSWTWSQQYGSPLMLFSVAFWGFLLHSQGWTASRTTADSWLMPSVSLTLCLKSSCEVAALSLAVCPRDRPPKSEHWNDGCHKWRIPLLTPGDRSVWECRRTKCFTQSFPSGHVYKVHGHTHTFGLGIQPQVLYCRIWEDRDIQKTSASEHLRDAEPLLSDWAMRPQSRLLHSSARHTSFRTRPCSSLLPKQHLPSLQCSSGCVVATSSLSTRLTALRWRLSLLMGLCCWCSFWPHGVTIGVPVF